MPSEYSRRQFTSWFRKAYPQEYYFFNKIESNLGKLYSNDYLALNDGEFAEISIQIQKLEGVSSFEILYKLLATSKYQAVPGIKDNIDSAKPTTGMYNPNPTTAKRIPANPVFLPNTLSFNIRNDRIRVANDKST